MLKLIMWLMLPVATGLFAGGNPSPGTFPAARQVSRAENRPIAIFFAPPGCPSCDAEWKAFLESAEAREYIPLRLSTDDFDAKSILDAWGPEKVPGWTILLPDGTVQDKWAGQWNKAPLVIAETPSHKPEPAPVRQPVTSPEVKPVSQVSEPVAAPEGFRIQAGYFGSKANAEKLLADLQAKGITDYEIRPVQAVAGTYYRVISRVHATEGEANQAAIALEDKGIKGAVKRTSEL